MKNMIKKIDYDNLLKISISLGALISTIAYVYDVFYK